MGKLPLKLTNLWRLLDQYPSNVRTVRLAREALVDLIKQTNRPGMQLAWSVGSEFLIQLSGGVFSEFKQLCLMILTYPHPNTSSA